MEKFSQPADENGHVLLPGFSSAGWLNFSIIFGLSGSVCDSVAVTFSGVNEFQLIICLFHAKDTIKVLPSKPVGKT